MSDERAVIIIMFKTHVSKSRWSNARRPMQWWTYVCKHICMLALCVVQIHLYTNCLTRRNSPSAISRDDLGFS